MTISELKQEIRNNNNLTTIQKDMILKILDVSDAESTNEGYGTNSDDILLG